MPERPALHRRRIDSRSTGSAAARYRQSRLESLELRNLLAGNCTAILSSGNLVIQCDAADNGLTVSQTPGFIHVTGNPTTKINGVLGVPASFASASVTQDVKISLRGGQDAVAVNGLSILDDLEIDGGKDSNHIEILHSTIADDVVIRNDSATISGGGGVIGQFVRLNDSRVGGGVRIANGDTTATSTGGPSEANHIEVTDMIDIAGRLKISNGSATSASAAGSSWGNRILIAGNRHLGGVEIDNDDARSSAAGPMNTSTANATRITGGGAAFATVIDGDVEIDYADGVSTANGAGGASTGNGTEVSNCLVRGDIEIEISEGDAAATGPGVSSVGNRTLVQGNIVAGDVEIAIGAGRAKSDGGASSSEGNITRVVTSNIDGELEIEIDESASLAIGPCGMSQDSLTELLAVRILGELEIETDNGRDRVVVQLVSVGGKTEIETGDDDDYIKILDSIFTGPVEVDGGNGSDTFENVVAGNTFPIGSPVLAHLETLI